VSIPVMHHRTEDAAMAVFRMAVNHRYQDRDGQRVDGSPTFVTVQCWGKLAQNVVSDGYKGMPVVVVGRLYQSTWTAQDSGERRSTLRIRTSHDSAGICLRQVAVRGEAGQLCGGRLVQGHAGRGGSSALPVHVDGEG